jgi:uncharacterized phage protein gp47/JayE
MSCPCDVRIHPRQLAIAAGLDTIPRQIATFPEYRAAMLASIRGEFLFAVALAFQADLDAGTISEGLRRAFESHAITLSEDQAITITTEVTDAQWRIGDGAQAQTYTVLKRSDALNVYRSRPALDAWRARGADDLGLMMLDWWAYVCDVLSFYDEVIAHEVYLRTARLRPSLRRLVALLGYVPRPAVAASVNLAILAEGRRSIMLPAGTAFRSGAFDGEPPQVFELDADTAVHPLNNAWALGVAPSGVLGDGSATVAQYTHLLFEPGASPLDKGDVVLVLVGDQPAQPPVATVKDVTTEEGKDRKKYTRVEFENALSLLQDTQLDQLTLLSPTQTGSPWTLTGSVGVEVVDDFTLIITLDGLYRQIKSGQWVLLSKGAAYRVFAVTTARDTAAELPEGDPVVVKDADGNVESTIEPPAISVPVTHLTLDYTPAVEAGSPSDLATWADGDASDYVVHYACVDGGTVTTRPGTTVTAADVDDLLIAGPLEAPVDGTSPARFLLEDVNETGLQVDGSLDYDTKELTLGQDPGWDATLVDPVTVYGNVVGATRGETVRDEVLGSGDASLASQSFVLKKRPLTYFASPTADNESGVASTLEVHIDNILWSEVPSFYGTTPQDEVYIVRQNDDGEAVITFGDGQWGARLPTGADNVVASYRYGAGAASPPAGSINQLAKPVRGLTSVRNPVKASGGGDAESADEIGKYAPRSALLLGRAVSIHDMEAVAVGVAGVRAVQAEWRWHGVKQRPVVYIWYIGEAGIEKTVAQTLRRLSDPTTPIEVEMAQAVATFLSIDIEIDERHLEDVVLAAVRPVLMDTETGLLPPERIGIGKPLYRSRIYEAVTSVPGVASVQGLQWNGVPFPSYAVSPGAGRYFDLESGALLLNGKAAAND